MNEQVYLAMAWTELRLEYKKEIPSELDLLRAVSYACFIEVVTGLNRHEVIERLMDERM